MTWTQRRALSLIEAYQRTFAARPSPCRFTPTCSSYAHEAFDVHGTARGGWLTLTRLLRCRPFGPSGFDPVPDRVPHVVPHALSDVVSDAVPSVHARTAGADLPVAPSPDVREVD